MDKQQSWNGLELWFADVCEISRPLLLQTLEQFTSHAAYLGKVTGRIRSLWGGEKNKSFVMVRNEGWLTCVLESKLKELARVWVASKLSLWAMPSIMLQVTPWTAWPSFLLRNSSVRFSSRLTHPFLIACNKLLTSYIVFHLGVLNRQLAHLICSGLSPLPTIFFKR